MTEPTAEKDDLVERLRRMSKRLDILDCEDVLQAADELTALRTQLASMRDALEDIAPAVESLASHQVQCDMDGIMVQVSRQAVDEVVNAINAIVIGPLAALNASPGSAGEGDLNFDDPKVSAIMGAVRHHTHDHTSAYAITKSVVAALTSHLEDK